MIYVPNFDDKTRFVEVRTATVFSSLVTVSVLKIRNLEASVNDQNGKLRKDSRNSGSNPTYCARITSES